MSGKRRARLMPPRAREIASFAPFPQVIHNGIPKYSAADFARLPIFKQSLARRGKPEISKARCE